jgi:transient receptor potential cation channel subfamily V member 5
LRQNTNCTRAIINTTHDMTYLIDDCKCAYLNPMDSNKWFRTVIELLVALIAGVYLALGIAELIRNHYTLFFISLKNEITRVIFLISCLMILIIIICRVSCEHTLEDYLVVLVTLFISTHFLYYFRGFRVLGPITLIIKNMVKGDLMRYLLIYFVFMMGFSQALYIVYEYGKHTEDTDNKFGTPFESILDVFMISIGEIGDYYNLLNYSQYQVIGKILLIVYIIVVCLLLVNMLIAMMGDTYATITVKKNEPLRQVSLK